MSILNFITEGMSVKQLTSLFYNGYQRVEPTKMRVQTHKFQQSLSSQYNASIANVFVDGDPRTSTLANILATMYTETHRTKQELFALYRSVKDLDQASVIIEDFIDDCFNTPDSEYNFTIKIGDEVADKEYIEKNLADLVNTFDLYQLDKDMNEDFLVYGDYYLNTVPEIGKGIVEINDNVELDNVFSIYKNNRLVQHIGMRRNTMFSNMSVASWAGQLMPIHPDLMAHFMINSRKINIALPDENTGVFSLPENIKIGRSVLFNALQLLKKYQLLDVALTYKEVRNALMPILLGVNTGAFTTPDNMLEACKAIESYLQEGMSMNIDMTDTDSLGQMLQGSASFKIAPIPGDKGSFNKLDIGTNVNETEGLSNILDDTGNRIAITSGGVTSNEAGKSRLEILKSNSRRSKRLIDIQRGKARGWQTLLHNHLRYQHINIEKESIKIQYKSIPNSDIFEDANGLVTLLSVINDLQTFADSVNQSGSGYKVDPQKMVDAFNLFIGNRYPVVKDFLQLDIAKKTFPKATDMINNIDKTQIATGAPKEEPEGPELRTASQSSTALTRMNKSFAGSSGSSSAVGS